MFEPEETARSHWMDSMMGSWSTWMRMWLWIITSWLIAGLFGFIVGLSQSGC